MLNEAQIQNTSNLTAVFSSMQTNVGIHLGSEQPATFSAVWRKVVLLDKTALRTFRIQRFKVRIRKVITDNRKDYQANSPQKVTDDISSPDISVSTSYSN